jgi:hypothetical protein
MQSGEKLGVSWGKISPLSFIKGRFGGFGRRKKDVFV